MKRKARRAHKTHHRVEAEVRQDFRLAKQSSSIKLRVYDGHALIGTIHVGAGSFGWRGRGDKKRRRFSWARMMRLMEIREPQLT
jgi:hypothetical protein